MIRPSLYFAVFSLTFTGVAVSQESVLLGDPQIEAAANAIRQRNATRVTRPVREIRTITEMRFCRYGLFGRRVRAVPVQRQVVVVRSISEVVINLDDGIGWNDLSDERIGFFEDQYPLKMLPRAAGARGTKINRGAEAYLKEGNSVEVEFRELDRVLVRTPRRLAGPVGARKLVRVEAKVGGLDDQNATINVKVQQRDAAGNLIVDKPGLTAEAKLIWNNITAELSK